MDFLFKRLGVLENLSEKTVFRIALYVSITVGLLHIIFFKHIGADASRFYGRMAEEFAKGNYKFAFQPIIPPLLSTIAGLFVKIGFPGYVALKIVNSVFYILGLFPLRSLMEKIVDNKKLAAWTCVVYVCSAYLIRYTFLDTPGSLKMFFLILSAYYVVRFGENFKLKYALYLGGSLALLALARGENIVFIPLYISWMVIFGIAGFIKKRFELSYIFKKELLGIIIIIITFIVICLPQMLYIQKYAGFPFTELRSGEILKKSIDISSQEINELADSTKDIQVNKKQEQKFYYRSNYWTYNDDVGIGAGIKGLGHIFVIFALLGLIWKFCRRKFNIYDLFFMTVVLYNMSVYLFPGFLVEYRYTVFTQPFIFGWVVTGGYFIYSRKNLPFVPQKLFSQYWKKLVSLVFAVILIGMLINGFNRFNKYLFRGSYYYTVGTWIKKHKKTLLSKKELKEENLLKPNVYPQYFLGRKPYLAAGDAQYGYWAGCDVIGIRKVSSYNEMLSFMKNKHLYILIFTEDVKERIPTFQKKAKKDFIKLKDFENYDITVYKRK